jgi:hypothetical protein
VVGVRVALVGQPGSGATDALGQVRLAGLALGTYQLSLRSTRATARPSRYFVRGFDADHGTDVAVSIDGLPVNVVSHRQGQGYADFHFVIPETVEQLKVCKGRAAEIHGPAHR